MLWEIEIISHYFIHWNKVGTINYEYINYECIAGWHVVLPASNFITMQLDCCFKNLSFKSDEHHECKFRIEFVLNKFCNESNSVEMLENTFLHYRCNYAFLRYVQFLTGTCLCVCIRKKFIIFSVPVNKYVYLYT